MTINESPHVTDIINNKRQFKGRTDFESVLYTFPIYNTLFRCLSPVIFDKLPLHLRRIMNMSINVRQQKYTNEPTNGN